MLVRVEGTNKFCAAAVTFHIKSSVLDLITYLKYLKL